MQQAKDKAKFRNEIVLEAIWKEQGHSPVIPPSTADVGVHTKFPEFPCFTL